MPSHRQVSEDHTHLFPSSLPTARCVHCFIPFYIISRQDRETIHRLKYRHLRRQNAFLVKRVQWSDPITTNVVPQQSPPPLTERHQNLQIIEPNQKQL